MRIIDTFTGYNKFLHDRRNGLSLLLLTAITLLVYAPVLWNDFLYAWDDQGMMNQYTEGGINLDNIRAIMTDFYHGQYAPANGYWYLILYSLFGYNPLWFHLGNLVLHIANVCLTYIIIARLLSKFEGNDRNVTSIGFVAALIFAIHPFNVETVAWISTSKVLIYACSYLLATYAYLQYLDRKKIGYYVLAMFLFVWSFLGKEQAVTFPIWLLMIFVLYKRNLKQWRPWLEVLPFFLLSLWFGYVTMLSQADVGGGFLSNEAAYPLWQRMVFACYSLLEYFLKCIAPVKLSYLYPFPSAIGDPLPQWLLVYPMLLMIILVGIWQYLRRQFVMLFALLFFTVHIAIALHILPLSRFAIIADRYVYLASIGITVIIAYYAMRLMKRYKTIVIAALSVYILCLGVYSHSRTKVWRDTDTLKKELREQLKERDDYKEITKDF
jgi:hypothetical protein